jgi:hypothetical protein
VYNQQKKFGILPGDLKLDDVEFSMSTLKEKQVESKQDED